MHPIVFSELQHYHWLGYFLAPLGTTLEGDGVLFAAGYLTSQGVYEPFCMFVALWIGTTLGDMLWYELGKYLEGKDNLIVRWLKKATNPIGPHLESRPFRTIFLSKFLYGINHALLAKAGSMQFSKQKLLRYNLLAIFLWVAIVGGLGYIGGASVHSIGHYVHYTELGLLAGLLLLLSAERIFTSLFRKKL